jgi:hypothetical protein
MLGKKHLVQTYRQNLGPEKEFLQVFPITY